MHNNTSSSSSSSSSSHKTPQQPARNKKLLQRPVSNADRPCKAIICCQNPTSEKQNKKTEISAKSKSNGHKNKRS
jgi:hypothetical protein